MLRRGICVGVQVSGCVAVAEVWAVGLVLFGAFGVLRFDGGFLFSLVALSRFVTSSFMVVLRWRGRCIMSVTCVYAWRRGSLSVF